MLLSDFGDCCSLSPKCQMQCSLSRCTKESDAHDHMTFTCHLLARASLARVNFDLMFSLHLRRLVITPPHSFSARGRGGALPIRIAFAHPSTSRRYPPCPPFLSTQRRSFVASSSPRTPPPDSRPSSPISPTPSSSSPPIRRSVLSRLLPASLLSNTGGTSSTAASFRKIVALARPERRPLLTAIGLLFVSSSVGLSIPFTVGKLIDYFTSPNPVRWSSSHCATVSILHFRAIMRLCKYVAAFLLL
jgi:hypothetical protein